MNTKIENIMGGEKGENLITKRELACRLKRTVRTITNWQRRGIIPYVRWRHAVYFDWQAVQARLELRGVPLGNPAQGILPFVAAHLRPRATQSQISHANGPVRLPVYQMREEPGNQRKKRHRTPSAPKGAKHHEHPSSD